MSNIKIRPLQDDDKQVWTMMLLDYYPPLKDKLQVSWWNAMQGDVQWNLAELDNTVVGFSAVVLHYTAFSSGEIAYLSDLYTHPKYRRMGVARALLEDVIATCRTLKLERVYWNTEHDNPARKLYDQYARADFTRYHLDLFGPT